MQLKCIVTDDEPVASEILEDYVRLIPGLELIATCRDAMETHAILRSRPVDLLFIDIQMPGITGLDFIRSLKHPPAVIFTTAYPNYAIDAFDLDVVDYLLKPISVERFLRAVNKLFLRQSPHSLKEDAMERPAAHEEARQFFFIKSNQDLVKIAYADILFIEGLENYVKIHCAGKVIISFATMRSMEEMLAPYRFLRIHRSYIVNLDKVDTIKNNIFCIRDTELVVGKSYRRPVAELLKQFYSM